MEIEQLLEQATSVRQVPDSPITLLQYETFQQKLRIDHSENFATPLDRLQSLLSWIRQQL